MRKFKPLDLSFIANASSPERESIRNVASMINANAGWSQPSNAFLAEYAQAKKDAEKASRNEPTFLSGLFDALQTPLYTVTNAMDEAIAGHQSDNNDSILQDVLKTIGGIGTGAAGGYMAGSRGSTAMLDVLPGVNFDDAWQANPEDKTHFSDVGIRNETGMSTADAMKPENWEKAKKKLKEGQDKDLMSKTFFELAIPDNLESEDAQKDFLKNYQMMGIAGDVIGDPLNFVPFSWGKKAADISKLTEGLDAARAVERLPGESAAVQAGSTFAPAPTVTEGFKLPSSQILDQASGKAPFPQVGSEGSKLKELPQTFVQGNAGRHVEIPKPGTKFRAKVGGYAVSPHEQDKLVKSITRLATEGQAGWVYKAADLLRAHGVDFANTESFLQLADRMAKTRNIRHNPAALSTSLKARIAEDVQKASSVTPAERLLNTFSPEQVLIRPPKATLRPQQLTIADEVIAKFTPEIVGKAMPSGTGPKLAAAKAAGRNANWSGPQQARMWNDIGTKLKYIKDPGKRFSVAAKILQHVEDHFLSQGKVPYSSAKLSESVEGLRLSQIAMALGPKTLGENPNLVTRILAGDQNALKSLTPEQLQNIEALKASEAVASAPAAQAGIGAGKEFIKSLLAKNQSVGRSAREMGKAISIAERVTLASGGGPVAAKTAGQYVGRLINEPGSINAFYRSKALETTAWLSQVKKGRPATPKVKAFNKKQTAYIARAANLPNSAALGNVAGPAARVQDWLGARFNAAYGVSDMRPIFLKQQASALSTSARRSLLINQLAKAFPPSDADLWHEAFRAAQADGVTTGRVSELQAEIGKVFENLFDGTGLRAGVVADSTVAGRSRLFMDELNSQLKRFGLGQYQFSNGKKVKDALGNERNFSKGTDWLKSWETWDVKKPYEFLHAVQNAVEHTVREKNMFDEIAARFASDKRFGNVKYGVAHPRLAGYFFTEEGAKQAQQFVKILDEVNTPSPKSLQHLDHVISKLKASLTIYIPSHHWTNIIGDVMFNWFAGVNDVRRYQQAAKVMSAQKGRYGDIASFGQLTGPDAFKQAIARGMVGTEALTQAGLKVNAAGNTVIATMKNGQKVTADMIYTAAMKEGILPSARVLEEITTETSSILDKIHLPGKAKGTVQRGAHVVSEVRDHVPRLAQFIDGISKSKGSFTSAVESSASAVRKWHPDGLDITRFERQVMKRVFPFYSWTRKAIPLAIESALVSGNKVMAYPRLMEEIALANGIDAPPGEQFPTDQLFPSWMRERGIGPVYGGPGSYGIVNPSTPALDIFSMMGHPGQSVLDMLNPMARVPAELAQGSTLGKQVPIENQGEYLAMQVPGLSQAGRVSGGFGVSDAVANSEEQQMLNLINLLTGAKATQSGIYQKSAQFDLRDYLSKKAKEKREG